MQTILILVFAFLKAIQLNPDYSDAYNEWGNVLIELGLPSLALQMYKQAILLNPNREVYYHNMGVAYNMLGDKINSKRNFEQALKISPSYSHSINELNRLSN